MLRRAVRSGTAGGTRGGVGGHTHRGCRGRGGYAALFLLLLRPCFPLCLRLFRLRARRRPDVPRVPRLGPTLPGVTSPSLHEGRSASTDGSGSLSAAAMAQSEPASASQTCSRSRCSFSSFSLLAASAARRCFSRSASSRFFCSRSRAATRSCSSLDRLSRRSADTASTPARRSRATPALASKATASAARSHSPSPRASSSPALSAARSASVSAPNAASALDGPASAHLRCRASGPGVGAAPVCATWPLASEKASRGPFSWRGVSGSPLPVAADSTGSSSSSGSESMETDQPRAAGAPVWAGGACKGRGGPRWEQILRRSGGRRQDATAAGCGRAMAIGWAAWRAGALGEADSLQLLSLAMAGPTTPLSASPAHVQKGEEY